MATSAMGQGDENMGYLDISVVVNGALDCDDAWTDEQINDQYDGDLDKLVHEYYVAKLTGPGIESAEVHVLHHEHDMDMDEDGNDDAECSCAQCVTDHRPYWRMSENS